MLSLLSAVQGAPSPPPLVAAPSAFTSKGVALVHTLTTDLHEMITHDRAAFDDIVHWTAATMAEKKRLMMYIAAAGGFLTTVAVSSLLVCARLARKKRAQQFKAKAQAIEEGLHHDAELLPVTPTEPDGSQLVNAAKASPTLKTHVELPGDRGVASVYIRKAVVVSFDALVEGIHFALCLEGYRNVLQTADIAEMEILYQDTEGDMIVLGRLSNMSEVIDEAQALFVSRRAAKGTRIMQGGRAAGRSQGRSAGVKLLHGGEEEGLGLLDGGSEVGSVTCSEPSCAGGK